MIYAFINHENLVNQAQAAMIKEANYGMAILALALSCH
jgi:hypothetical protein